MFEAAIPKSGKPSAALLSDLAAVHLARAQLLGRPSDLARGLEWALQATARDPRSAAAQFNLGLLCRELGLQQCSRAAWDAYLGLDSHSPWAGEVRRYQRELLDPTGGSAVPVEDQLRQALRRNDSVSLRYLASTSPATAESWVTDELLGQWAAALQAGRIEEARDLLAYARQIGESLSPRGRGSRLLEVIEPLEVDVQKLPVPAGLATLAEGHREYSQGSQLLESHQNQEASLHFASAKRALARGGSPFSIEAELQRITCLVLDNRYEQALAALDQVEPRQAALAPAVSGRIAWLRAASEIQLRRPLEAIASYKRAAHFYRTAGDMANFVNVEMRLAEALENIGQQEEAWRWRYLALAGLEHLDDRKRRPFVLGEASGAALVGGWSHAARLFQEAAVEEARRAGDELWLAEALRQLAMVDFESGREEEALASLREAWELIRDTRPSPLTKAIDLKLHELEGRAALPQDPKRALSHFAAAIERAQELGQVLYLSALHLEEAEALEALGNPGQVQAALRKAVELSDTEWEDTLQRRTGGEYEDLWPTYFGSRRRPFDRLIRKLYEAGETSGALTIAEKARAREVLDLLRGQAPLQPGLRGLFSGRARPLAASEVAVRLPRRTALVEYALADGQLFIWVVGRDGIRFVDAWPTAAEVTRLAEATAKDLRSSVRQAQIQEDLAALFDHLVAPFFQRLQPGERLVFVPDGALHEVPFAALYDQNAHQYLIESHPVSSAPSATLYAYTVLRNRELVVTRPPGVLCLGDPAFNQAEFPSLDRLDGASRECRAVAPLYPTSRVYTDRQATKRRFLEALGKYPVVHFAGHAVGHPSEAYLVLAPDEPGASGALYARELLSRPPGRTRLVFLSACSSAGEQARGGQGVAALVRPLIGAGIPAVVGTLWPVDDDTAVELATAFHRHLLAGKDAPAALQAAQLEFLKDKRLLFQLPQSWAAFQVVGHASLKGADKEE